MTASASDHLRATCVRGSRCDRSSSLGMRERGWRPAADDGWGFMNEGVIPECLNHEQMEVDPTVQVAPEHGVADMATPYGQAFAFAFLQCATANNRPCSV